MTKTRKATWAVMLVDTFSLRGSFLTGAAKGEIKTGEKVKVTESIEKPLFGGGPKMRVQARDGRYAWVSPNDVQLS